MPAHLLLVALVGAELFSQGLRPVDDAAPPPGLGLAAASCAGCHIEQHKAWQDSRHQRSYTNRNFAASLAQSREKVWCTNCHLPLAEAQASAALAQEGIN